MIAYYRYSAIVLFGIFSILSPSYSKTMSAVPKDRVMTIDEFKQAINNNDFLKQQRKTVKYYSLDKYEVKMIEKAIKDENSHFGGKFDRGREVNNFTGDTLLVGGGKKSGMCGENQGKTVLIDNKINDEEVRILIENLRSDKWDHDPYTGKEFKSDAEKEFYIKELERKQKLYQQAFREKNKDILNRYYTLNIEKDLQPDMLGSITSEADMSKIPNNKFMHVEFENVPCDVFLNPKLYPILERITKPGGTIKFSVSNSCRRLMIPVIQQTKFGKEFISNLKAEYNTLERIHPTYNPIMITVIN